MKQKKKSGWLDGIEAAQAADKEPSRESQAVLEQDAILRLLTERLKKIGNPDDVQLARDSSVAAEVALPELHNVASIGERLKGSKKVKPVECRTAYERQRKANPDGSYTALCDAVAAEFGCAGRTVRRYVPNPSPRRTRKR